MPTATPLNDLTKFVYGTTRLGDAKIPKEDRIKVARAAMDSGMWFHTSHQYGNALEILRAAFDQDRAKVPKLIYKIGWNDIKQLRENIQLHLTALNLPHMDMGQLCLGGELAEQFRSGGACYGEFQKLKDEGLVRRLVVEVFPWTSQGPLEAIQKGYPKDVIDGYILYVNPLQRFASNALWDEMQRQNIPIVAMRTVAGGSVIRLRDVPGAAWKEYLRERAIEVAPLFERSGIGSWTEFCVRFAFGVPNVHATVGSSSKIENLNEFLTAIRDIKPLPADIQDEIFRLQRRWSDEKDIHAEPWSM